MLLTSIEPRRRGFSVLYFEDGSGLRILTEVALSEKLRPGTDIPEERMEELLRKSRLKRAGEKALTLLEYRSYSKKELEDRLSRESGNTPGIWGMKKAGGARSPLCSAWGTGLRISAAYYGNILNILKIRMRKNAQFCGNDQPWLCQKPGGR